MFFFFFKKKVLNQSTEICMYLLLFLILTKLMPNSFPPYSIIYVCTTLTEYQIKEFEEFVRLINDDRQEYCRINPEYLTPIEECVKKLDNIDGVQFSTGNDINTKISRVSKNSEFLFILCDGIGDVVNFSNLKTELVVYLSYETDIYSSNEIGKYPVNYGKLMTNTLKSIQRITRNTHMPESKSFFDIADRLLGEEVKEYGDDLYPTTPILNVSIEGNIKSKVSCLSTSNIRIKIVNNDLNIHYLYCYDSEIDQESKDINTTFYISDRNSHYRLYGKAFYKFHVEQYGIIMFDSLKSAHQMIIYPDYWAVISSSYNDYYLHVYHLMAKSYNWIVCGRILYIYPFSSDIGDDNLINISVISNMPRRTLSNEKYTKNRIEIIAIGNWSSVRKKPKISINFDPDVFYFYNNATVTSMFSINESKLPYSYIPREKLVTPTSPNFGKKNNGLVIGYICGVTYVVVLSLILITIAFVYRPKKVNLSEDEYPLE